MKAIKKACGGTSLYPKKSSVSSKLKTGGTVKKAQSGGTYYATSKGRVGRLSSSTIGGNISAVQNESIDTTGYSKGKKDFTKTTYRTFQKPTAQKVKRENVSKVISNLKEGATRTDDYRTTPQKKKNKLKSGGTVKAKDGKWIQKAVNPKHKGYCTPMTKATCTPRRKALAKTFKKMAKERKGK